MVIHKALSPVTSKHLRFHGYSSPGAFVDVHVLVIMYLFKRDCLVTGCCFPHSSTSPDHHSMLVHDYIGALDRDVRI
jgi:hypothetical protein